MKKIIIILISLVVVGFLGYFIYVNYIKEQIPKINVEEEKVSISKYFIYGNHFNIEGTLDVLDKNYQDIELILYNGEEKEIEINTELEDNKIKFYLSDKINEGFYLDEIERGTYFLFLKLIYENKEDEEKPITKYYVLDNNTEYDTTEYYTLSKYNNRIIINSDNEYNTMNFIVSENKTKNDVADITIDPGHGGMDGGGAANGYKETDFTMNISQKIKSELEELGLKVKLTHEEGHLSQSEVLEEYNTHGRAVVPNEVKSKYTLSIHINKNTSSSVSGLEIYTADNINYDFAKSLANNITSYTGLDYSTNRLYKMFDGVYTHNFTEAEIATSLEGYEERGYTPYNVTENSNYLYMIRETGGFMTGAYIDNSNPDEVGVNEYYNSNVGNETYLLELGYISNIDDLNNLIEKEDKYVEAIVLSVKEELGL